MEPSNPLGSLRRRWRVVALTMLIALVSTWVASPGKPGDAGRPLYGSTTRLVYQPPTNTAVAAGQRASSRNATGLGTIAALTTGNEVARKAAEKLGYTGPPARLAREVKATAESESSTIDVTAESHDRAKADQVADAFAASLIEVLDSRSQAQRDQALVELNARLKTLQDGIRRLDAQIAQTPLAAQGVPVAQRDALVRQYSVAYEQLDQYTGQPGSASGLTVLLDGEARPVDRGLQPPQTRSGRLLLALLISVVVGGGLALVLDRLDRGVRNKAMAEAAFGVPVLAEIPPVSLRGRKGMPLFTATRPNSTVAEAYRTLRSALLLMHGHGDPDANGRGSDAGVEAEDLHVIMVSSPNPSEGKTTTAANLAVTFAESGKNVLVIDCDLRHPRVHKYLGVPEGPGLSDVLIAGSRGPSLRDVMRTTAVPGVRMVTSGRAVDNPSELFARGHDVIAAARDLAEVVILDTPPVLVINDAVELSPLADAVVLVCRSGRTTAEEASRASELLLRLGAPLAGVVVVGSTEAPTNKSSYYYYYYRSEQNVGGGLSRLLHRSRRPRPIEPATRPESRPKNRPQNPPRQKGGGKNARKQQPAQPAPKQTNQQRPPAAQVASPPAPASPSPGGPAPSATPQAATQAAPQQPSSQPAPQPAPPQQRATPQPQPAPASQARSGQNNDVWAPEEVPVAYGVDPVDLTDPDNVSPGDMVPDDPFRRP